MRKTNPLTTHTAQIRHLQAHSFQASLDGFDLVMDAPETGPSAGHSPKKLMLAALAGCTGVDVVSILDKMKVPYQHLHIRVSATLTEEHPKIYDTVDIRFELEAEEIHRDKILRAVELSRDKYCGVSAMFNRFATLHWEVVLLPPSAA